MARKANIVLGAVVAIVVVAAVAAFAMLQAPSAQTDAHGAYRAIVHDADGKTWELPLDRDGETVVETSLGTNVVAVESGGVFVREADCGNQDCVHQGRIDAPGKQIICLPHKLWIEIVASDDRGAGQMDVAAVAGSGSSGGDGDGDGESASDGDGLDVVAR